MKQYRLKNKEKVQEYNQQYFQDPEEVIAPQFKAPEVIDPDEVKY